MNQQPLIAVAGRARHGKDTICDILVENYAFKKVAWADKVYEYALILDPWIGRDFMGFYRLSTLVEKYGWERTKTEYPEARKFLQDVGNGGRIIFGEDIWLNRLFEQLLPEHRYCVTGTRHHNETKAAKQRGGMVWKVVRPNFDNGVDSNHPSERYIDELYYDHLIVNESDLIALERWVHGLIGHYIKLYPETYSCLIGHWQDHGKKLQSGEISPPCKL